MSLKTYLTCVACTLGFCLNLGAQGFSVGLFHSPKGLGAAYERVDFETEESECVLLYADMADVFDGTFDDPGIKATYLHNFVFAVADDPGADIRVLVGLGASLGYVRDRSEAGYGCCSSVCANLACKVLFRPNIDIHFGFIPEFGLFVKKNDSETEVKLYRNGLTNAILPYITIAYRFR